MSASVTTAATNVFEATSAGDNLEKWIRATKEENKTEISPMADWLLHTIVTATTIGVKYKVGVVKGEEIADEKTNRFGTDDVLKRAEQNKWMDLPAETALLVPGIFLDEVIEKMGLWTLVLMHKPYDGQTANSAKGPIFLAICRTFPGDPKQYLAKVNRRIGVCSIGAGRSWSKGDGFIFLIPNKKD